MIATLLFTAFVVMMLAGVPIGAAMGLAGAACIALANADAQWFGLLAVPQNFYAGLGKYPLLAIPMFVLVGSIFDRSGVAARLVNFAVAIVLVALPCAIGNRTCTTRNRLWKKRKRCTCCARPYTA